MSDVPYEQRPDVLTWRLQKAADSIKDLELWRRDVDRDAATSAERDKYVIQEVKSLREDFEDFRKAITRTGLGLIASLIMFSLTVLAAAGKI